MSHLQKKRGPKSQKEVRRFLIYLPGKWNHLIHLAQKDLEQIQPFLVVFGRLMKGIRVSPQISMA